jgi:hypothetical protein
MTTVAETRAANEKRGVLLQELKDRHAAMLARAPGKPAIFVPLDQVFTFKGENGEPLAVIPVEQLIYMVDEILRS